MRARTFSGTAWTGHRGRLGHRAVFDAREIRRGRKKGWFEVYYKHGTSQGLTWKRAIVETYQPAKETTGIGKIDKTDKSPGAKAPGQKNTICEDRRQGPQPVRQESRIPAQGRFMGF